MGAEETRERNRQAKLKRARERRKAAKAREKAERAKQTRLEDAQKRAEKRRQEMFDRKTTLEEDNARKKREEGKTKLEDAQARAEKLRQEKFKRETTLEEDRREDRKKENRDREKAREAERKTKLEDAQKRSEDLRKELFGLEKEAAAANEENHALPEQPKKTKGTLRGKRVGAIEPEIADEKQALAHFHIASIFEALDEAITGIEENEIDSGGVRSHISAFALVARGNLASNAVDALRLCVGVPFGSSKHDDGQAKP